MPRSCQFYSLLRSVAEQIRCVFTASATATHVTGDRNIAYRNPRRWLWNQHGCCLFKVATAIESPVPSRVLEENDRLVTF